MIKKYLKPLLPGLLIALVLLLLLEALFTLWLNFPQFIPSRFLAHYREYYRVRDRSIIQVTDCAQYDPDLFYTLKPGACIFRNREFTIRDSVNSAGVRDDEQSLVRPEIIVLGDSYAMGWGVEQHDTYAQRLERKLNRKVLNAGISSYGTARELRLLERLDKNALQYLIIQYHPNDFEENKTALAHHYDLPVRSAQQYDSLKRSIHSRTRYYPLKYTAEILASKILNVWGKRGWDNEQDEEEAYAFLKLLSHTRGLENVTIIVFELEDFPTLNSGFVTQLSRLLRENLEFQHLNITALPAHEWLTEADYFILDEHINANGHRAIANQLSKLFENKIFVNKTVKIGSQ